MTYTVGWYNVDPGESVIWRRCGNTDTQQIAVIPGLYRFKRLKEFIQTVGSFGTLELNKEYGLVALLFQMINQFI